MFEVFLRKTEGRVSALMKTLGLQVIVGDTKAKKIF